MTHLDLASTPRISALPWFPDALAPLLRACPTRLRPVVAEFLTLGAFIAMCVGLMVEFS